MKPGTIQLEKVDKLYKLLDIALDDLARVEISPNYVVDMSCWHEPNADTGKCQVCLAGAVMAMSLESNPKFSVVPDTFEGFSTKLQALDEIRVGNVEGAINCFYEEEATYPENYPDDVSVPLYTKGNSDWWIAMRELSSTLKEANI